MSRFNYLAKLVLESFDCNFYANGYVLTLMFDWGQIDVESMWYSEEEDKVYLHVGCKDFEGDLIIDSLSDDNINRLISVFLDMLTSA